MTPSIAAVTLGWFGVRTSSGVPLRWPHGDVHALAVWSGSTCSTASRTDGRRELPGVPGSGAVGGCSRQLIQLAIITSGAQRTSQVRSRRPGPAIGAAGSLVLWARSSQAPARSARPRDHHGASGCCGRLSAAATIGSGRPRQSRRPDVMSNCSDRSPGSSARRSGRTETTRIARSRRGSMTARSYWAPIAQWRRNDGTPCVTQPLVASDAPRRAWLHRIAQQRGGDDP